MNTLNMNKHSGYPMLQIAKLGENIIEFCHNEAVEIGDRVHIVLRKFEDTRNAEFDISEIIEQRKAKGKHAVKNVNWFKARICEPSLFQ